MFSSHNIHLLSVCVLFDIPDIPKAPANFSGMVFMDDTDPVTVMFTWDGLVGGSATGISSNGDQSLNYTVSIDGTSTTVTTSMEMIEVTDLASCTEYSATLVASNKVNTGPPTTGNFTTTEKGEYMTLHYINDLMEVQFKVLLYSWSSSVPHAKCDIRRQRDLCFFPC